MPDAPIASCDQLIEEMKAVKTSKELAMLRTASAVAADGFAAAFDSIVPGRRETEVAADVQSASEKSVHAESLQRSYGYYLCMSGPNSAKASAAYARTRERVIEQGDLVRIHANTCADGYWTDITRTFTAGEPSGRQQSLRSAISQARQAGLDTIRPGVTGADVDHAVRAVMKSARHHADSGED